MHAGVLERTRISPVIPGPSLVAVARTSSPAIDFGEYLERQMAHAGFENREQLARASGVEATTIGRWIRGERPPTIEKLRDIAPHLKVRLGDLMVRAGLATREELGMIGASPPPGPPLPPVLRSVMARLASPRLSDKRKNFLLQYIQEIVDKFDEITEQIDEEVAAQRRGRR
jgi:transcriptional regulator with XRE-family HTH domain